jgi:dihydroorotase
VTLQRAETTVADRVAGLVPFHAGERLGWRLME